jgi:hypothetical protein
MKLMINLNHIVIYNQTIIVYWIFFPTQQYTADNPNEQQS